jgi:hypothetical protein
VEKECLALVWGVQKFQKYLYGTHFHVQSDHQPLSFLSSAAQANARVMRWAMLLQPYSFQVTYLPGNSNNLADFLSRHPLESRENQRLTLSPTSDQITLDPKASEFRPARM